MFHYDRGLKITSIDLGVDICRRQPRGFVSHAHADHMGPHELAYATAPTCALYRHRMGEHRQVKTMAVGEFIELDDTRFAALPAGHILGAAMLFVEDRHQSLLYTGDFRLHESLTAGKAELRTADVLVMETTFGQAKYRFPPRDETWQRLVDSIESAWKDDRTPIIRAYSLGKSQEVTKALTDRGMRVLQHPKTFAISQIYNQFGCDLGDVREFRHASDKHDEDINTQTGVKESGADQPCADQPCADQPCADQPSVIVTPPKGQRGSYLELPARRVEIAVTGWALDPRTKYRLGVDEAIPLSDHADFDELIECVERVEPRRIYCTHGDASFCNFLNELGHDARILGDETHQKRLF